MITLTGTLSFSDDYPWVRPITPQGEIIDTDVTPLLPYDPTPSSVSADPCVPDRSGRVWHVHILDDTIEPPRLKTVAITGATIPCVALSGGLRYIVGTLGGSVLYADPQRWTDDANAQDLRGWLLFAETSVEERAVHDFVAYTLPDQDVRIVEDDRVWDDIRGWSLRITDGDKPTVRTEGRYALSDEYTHTFWIKPTQLESADYVITHGPVRYSLVSSGGDLLLSVTMDDVTATLPTATLVIGEWNFVACRVTGTTVTVYGGSISSAVTSSAAIASPRSFSTDSQARTSVLTADGSADFEVAMNHAAADPSYVSVDVDGEAWLVVDSLATAGPGDKVFELRYAGGLPIIRFGNGFNGAIPPEDASITVGYSTYDTTITFRTDAQTYYISDFRTYGRAKTEDEINKIRLPSFVEAPVEWSTRYLTALNRKNRYSLSMLPCGLVYASVAAGATNQDREKSFVAVQRYTTDGAYIGDPARELLGVGGGALPPSTIRLGSRFFGYDSSSVVTYSGTHGYPVGSVTASALTNPTVRRIYLREGSIVYKAALDYTAGSGVRLLAEPVLVDREGTLPPVYPNIPTDGNTYTYTGAWTATGYQARSVVWSGTTFWYATAPAISTDVPPASPWLPAPSLGDLRYDDVITDAVCIYGSNTRSLGVRYGSEVYARGTNTGTQSPVYLYLDERSVIDANAADTWTSGGDVYADRVELSAAGVLVFEHAELIEAGRYRLYLDVGNNGLLDRGFDGFDLEISIGNDEFPIVVESRVFTDHAGEQDPREEVYVDVTIDSDIVCPWTLSVRWTNPIDNNDNWQRIFQLFGYRLELQQPSVYSVNIPASGTAIVLSEVTVSPSGPTTPTYPGGWIGYPNSYGTIAAGSWIHESQSYFGNSARPASHVLGATTANKFEDLYTASWYVSDAVSGPVSSPTVTVAGSRERETITLSVSAPVGTLRYAWDLTGFGEGWTDGQTVTAVPQTYGSLPYTAYAVDPNGYYATRVGTVVVKEAPDIMFVRTSVDDTIAPYTFTGTVYGTCITGTNLAYNWYLNGSLVHTGTSTSPFGRYKATLTCPTAGAHTLKVVAHQSPQDTWDEVYMNIHGRESIAPSVSPIRSNPSEIYEGSETPYTFSVVAYDEDGEEADLTFTWSILPALSYTQAETSWGNDRVQSDITVDVSGTESGDTYVISVVVEDAHGRQTTRYLRMEVAANTPPELVEDADGEVIVVTPGTVVPVGQSVLFSTTRVADAEQQYPVTYAWSLWLHKSPTLPITHTLADVDGITNYLASTTGQRTTVRVTAQAIAAQITLQSTTVPIYSGELFVHIYGKGNATRIQSDGQQFRGIVVRVQSTLNGVPMWVFSNGDGTGTNVSGNIWATNLSPAQEANVNVTIWPVMKVTRELTLTTNWDTGIVEVDDVRGVLNHISRGRDNALDWADIFPLELKNTEDFGTLSLVNYPEEYASFGEHAVFKVTVASVATATSDTLYTAASRVASVYAVADEGSSATITGSVVLTDDRGGTSTYPVPQVEVLERVMPPYITPPNGNVDTTEPVPVVLRERTPGAKIRYTYGPAPDSPTETTGVLYARSVGREQIIQIKILKDYLEGSVEWYSTAFVLYAGTTPYYFWFGNQTGRGQDTPEPTTVPTGAILTEIPFYRSDLTPRIGHYTCSFAVNSPNVTLTPIGSAVPFYAGWELVDKRVTRASGNVLAGGEYVDSVTSATALVMSSVALSTLSEVPVDLVGGSLSKSDIARMIAFAINSQSEFTARVTGETVAVSIAGGATHDFDAADTYLSYSTILEGIDTYDPEVTVPLGQTIKAISYKDNMYPSAVISATYRSV